MFGVKKQDKLNNATIDGFPIQEPASNNGSKMDTLENFRL